MRWNNLGISYLDQLQYSEAIDAFAHVVKLRPDYADGYTNIGLTNIEWEKYESARGGLEKALELAPNNARALYYLALVERRAGHSDAEVADLQKVIAQYPQSRDARRELGISYYQQRKPQEAMEQFEALQAIDPDDLAAHYNLAILYRRLGLKDKAATEAAYFADQKDDPTASTYALEYLRKHHEIAQESVPWHVHDLDKHGKDEANPPQIINAPTSADASGGIGR
jgi:tetratricopeptide (TPR) repeat protein